MMTFLTRCKNLVLMACVVGSLLIPVAAEAQVTLKAKVEQNAQAVDGNLAGQVIDAQTGAPLRGATVSLPDQQFNMTTGPDGSYSVPAVRGQSPVIMSITRPGYQPFSVSISESTPPKLRIQLSRVTHTIVLDDTLRHLGDDSYNPLSNGAMQFHKAADGPVMTYRFSLPADTSLGPITVQIGSIVGLDTRLAHMLSHSPISVSATPLLVVLNGEIIAQISVDGDNRKIRLPAEDLNTQAQNTLQLKAGYHYTDESRIDYDDMEYIHVTVQY